MIFQDRDEAGRKLADRLKDCLGQQARQQPTLVLAIPRGGVLVAKPIADFFQLPLDLIIVKKIGAPTNLELAIGAVSATGEPIIDENLVKQTGATEEYLSQTIVKLKEEVKNKELFLRGKRPQSDFKGKNLIIVDDGVATGSTIKAAIEIARQDNPARITIAIPVIAKDTLSVIESLADEVVYLDVPELFFAVGKFYKNFDQVTDNEVKNIIENYG